MSKEQIEEMAKYCCNACEFADSVDIENHFYPCAIDNEYKTCGLALETARNLYNAGYRKQSENTIELPCKVGETIYLPWEFDGVRSIAYLTVTHIIFDREHNYVKTDFETDDEVYYDKYQCGEYEFEDFGKIVFLTIEEAEAKMKGGAE